MYIHKHRIPPKIVKLSFISLSWTKIHANIAQQLITCTANLSYLVSSDLTKACPFGTVLQCSWYKWTFTKVNQISVFQHACYTLTTWGENFFRGEGTKQKLKILMVKKLAMFYNSQLPPPTERSYRRAKKHGPHIYPAQATGFESQYCSL